MIVWRQNDDARREFVIDTETGYVLFRRVWVRAYGMIADMLSGRVLEGGLGTGTLRGALHRNPAVTRIRTVELSLDVIAEWRARRGSGPWAPSPENANKTVEQADVKAVLQAEKDAGRRPFDCIVLDVADDPSLRDPDLLPLARWSLNLPGNRMVLVSDRDRLAVPGFKAKRWIDDQGLRIWVCDRWEPGAGIGTARAGGRRVPNVGWRD